MKVRSIVERGPCRWPGANPELSVHVWETRYRHRPGDATLDETWRRVARAVAEVEPPEARRLWEEQFFSALRNLRLLPGGRIVAGAGTGHKVTLFNCFVMGRIEDSLDGIFEALKEGALTMQQGGGVGYDFSTLRPQGFAARTAGTIASGPVSFMRIWDAMCATLLSTGARRGAMMATLRSDHPDIEAFVTAKARPGELSHFNLSVQVPEELLEAVAHDAPWPLVFPASALGDMDDVDEGEVARWWSGEEGPVACRVVRTVRARDLWRKIVGSAYECGEPGVLFVDRINRWNNLWYRERITATNPCGEAPLPPYGACDLASLELSRFVLDPFTPEARWDLRGLEEVAAIGVRLLDDVIDASSVPLPAQAEAMQATRRIGLGVTGLADALILMGLPYDAPEGRNAAAEALATICHAAYRTSIGLARERGPFPALDRKRHLEGPFIRSLPEDIRRGIERHGIRNSHLLAIAPTGTISLLAGNVSSGIEPVFAARSRRRVRQADGSVRELDAVDPAWSRWTETHGPDEPLPRAFRTAADLSSAAHIEMQSALQPLVDGAISKTVNVPHEVTLAAFRDLYLLADERGLKGLTVFRPGPTHPGILEARSEAATAGEPCCDRERPPDEEAGMTRNFVRSNDPWDLEQQENDLIQAGYRQVERAELQPGEFRRVSELDELEHQPVVTLEWEDGIEA